MISRFTTFTVRLSKVIKWVRHVARVRKNRNVIRTLVANLKGRDPLQDVGVDEG
jgi:hypothetical protein